MAVPYINILAPSMGGIGPVELSDLPMLGQLSGNGVPFYAGRFYPKDSDAIFDGLQLGFISETPPWLTWEEIKPTQIWMVPINPDERIVTMNCTIERIDIRPRSMDDYEGMDDATAAELVSWEPPIYSSDVVERAHGQVNLLPSFNGSLDPGVEIEQNLSFIPPIITNGFLGITQITGRCTEWGFYDQEMTIVNGTNYGQPQYGYGGADELGYEYAEVLKVRPDGVWARRDITIDYDGTIPEFSGPGDGTWDQIVQNSYLDTAISEYADAATIGNAYYDQFTKVEDASGNPRAGLIAEIKGSEMDTVIYTIKVACTTIVVPDFITGPDEAVRAELAASAVQSFASNLLNNIWYFYWPVRYNGDIPNQRYEQYFSKAGINNVTTDISL